MNYLKLQLNFLINRYSVVIIFIMILLMNFGVIYNSGIFQGYEYLDLNRSYNQRLFLSDSVAMIKIGSILVSVLLSSIAGLKSNNDLIKYTVQSKYERCKFIISRILSLIFIVTLFNTSYWLFYIQTTNYLLPYSVNINDIIIIYRYLLIQAYFYIMITLIFIQMFKSFFIAFIPIILFWIMETNSDYEIIKNNTFIDNLYRIVPNLVYYQEKFIMVYDEFDYLLTIIMFVSIYILWLLSFDFS